MAPLVQRPGRPDINGKPRHHQQDIEDVPVFQDEIRYEFDRLLPSSRRISRSGIGKRS
jgi:hypothetical protein